MDTLFRNLLLTFCLSFGWVAQATVTLVTIPDSRDIPKWLVEQQMTQSLSMCERAAWGHALYLNFGPLKRNAQIRAAYEKEYNEVEAHIRELVAEHKAGQALVAKLNPVTPDEKARAQTLATLFTQSLKRTEDLADISAKYQIHQTAVEDLRRQIQEARDQEEKERLAQLAARHAQELRLAEVNDQSLATVLENFYQLQGGSRAVTVAQLASKFGTEGLAEVAQFFYQEYRLAKVARATSQLSPLATEGLDLRLQTDRIFLEQLANGEKQLEDIERLKFARRLSGRVQKAELYREALGKDFSFGRDLRAPEREGLAAGALTHLELYTALIVANQNIEAPERPDAPNIPTFRMPTRPDQPPARFSSRSQYNRVKREWDEYKDAVASLKKRYETTKRLIANYKENQFPDYQRAVVKYRGLLAKKQLALQVVAYYLMKNFPALSDATDTRKAQTFVAERVREARQHFGAEGVARVEENLKIAARRPRLYTKNDSRRYGPDSDIHYADSGSDFWFWWWFMNSNNNGWVQSEGAGIQSGLAGFSDIPSQALHAIGANSTAEMGGASWLPGSAHASGDLAPTSTESSLGAALGAFEAPHFGVMPHVAAIEAAMLSSDLSLADAASLPDLGTAFDSALPDMGSGLPDVPSFEMPTMPDVPDMGSFDTPSFDTPSFDAPTFDSGTSDFGGGGGDFGGGGGDFGGGGGDF